VAYKTCLGHFDEGSHCVDYNTHTIHQGHMHATIIGDDMETHT